MAISKVVKPQEKANDGSDPFVLDENFPTLVWPTKPDDEEYPPSAMATTLHTYHL
jgi:hypothetical protein